MRWIITLALFALPMVAALVLRVVVGPYQSYLIMSYGGVGGIGVLIYRIAPALDIPPWIRWAGLALPWIYAVPNLVAGAPFEAMVPFLLCNTAVVAVLTFGSWTQLLLDWADQTRDGALIVKAFLFPAIFAVVAIPLGLYLNATTPDKGFQMSYNPTAGEFLRGLAENLLLIFGFIAAAGAAMALIVMGWLLFLRATGMRREK